MDKLEQENKYYTPFIEEFHVGFEYEVLLNNDKWEKHIFKPNKDNFCHRFMEETWFTDEKNSRVKYLDKEDIESLGFDNTSEDEYYSKDEKYNIYTGNKNLEIYSENVCFKGTIKNKSELKVILSQLGV